MNSRLLDLPTSSAGSYEIILRKIGNFRGVESVLPVDECIQVRSNDCCQVWKNTKDADGVRLCEWASGLT